MDPNHADAAAAAPASVRPPQSIVGIDPGVSNVGMAVLHLSPKTAVSPARAACAITPLAAATWAQHATWTAQWHVLGVQGRGGDFFEQFIQALQTQPRVPPKRVTHVVIEQQPASMGHPLVRVAEGMLHMHCATAYPAAARHAQSGALKNRLVQALGACWPRALGLKFRKQPRRTAWTAVAENGEQWCQVTLPAPAKDAGTGAADGGGGGGGRREPSEKTAPSVCVSVPPDVHAGGLCAMRHGDVVPLSAVIPPRRKRPRPVPVAAGAAATDEAHAPTATASDARAAAKAAAGAAWRSNKAHGEEVTTALLCIRAACKHGPTARNARDLLRRMAVLPTDHRHDMCDALLHALAFTVYAMT